MSSRTLRIKRLKLSKCKNSLYHIKGFNVRLSKQPELEIENATFNIIVFFGSVKK